MHTPRPTIKPVPPTSPRSWLAAVRNIVGKDYFKSLFCIQDRTATRWIAQRPYVAEESVRSNYLENHETLLTRLMDDGYETIARAIVAHHAHLVGCELVRSTASVPDRDTIEDEMLDDYPALTEYHRAIRTGSSIDAIIELKNRVIDELNQTLELSVKK